MVDADFLIDPWEDYKILNERKVIFMEKIKGLTWKEKDMVMEALTYYRDKASQLDEEGCGLKGHQRKVMNRAIDKINKGALL